MPAAAQDAAVIELPPVVIESESDATLLQDGYVAIEGRQATKVDTPIGSIPQPVSVVTQDQIEDQKPRTLLEALTYTPGANPDAFGYDTRYDAYAVQNLRAEERGWGNAAQVEGAYLGAAIGGGALVVAIDRFGWATGAWGAAVMVALSVPFPLQSSRGARPAERPHTPSLRSALVRPEVRRGLGIAAIFVLAQKTATGMLGPFLIDEGLDLSTVGALSGSAGLGLGLAGAVAGGALTRGFGARRVMAGALLLQAACLGLICLHARSGLLPQAALVAVALAAGSAVMSIGFVALYSQFMRRSDPRQAGVDFTLFQCADAAVSMVGGVLAGIIAGGLGYAAFFGGAAFLALAALPFMLRATAKDGVAS